MVYGILALNVMWKNFTRNTQLEAVPGKKTKQNWSPSLVEHN